MLANWKRIALCACMLPLLAGVARADGFGELIPEDAKIVVAVHDVKKAGANLRAFVDAIGAPVPPGMDVSQLSMMSGLGELWPLEKGAVFVVLDPMEKRMALILPVTDAKAALAKIGGKGDGEYQKVNFPPGQEESFAMVKGNYLIIGHSLR